MEIARCEEFMNVPSTGMARTGNPSSGFEILITQLLEQSKELVGEGSPPEGQPVAADQKGDDEVFEAFVEAGDVSPGWYLLAEGHQPLKGLGITGELRPKELSEQIQGKREPESVGERIPMPKHWKEEAPISKIPEESRSVPERLPGNLVASVQAKSPSEPVARMERDDGFQDTLKKITQNHQAEAFIVSNDPGQKPMFQEVAASAKIEVPATLAGVDLEGNLQKIQEALQKNEITIRSQNQTHLKVQLEPEHLGKVDLDLSMEQGKLTAKINVESEKVMKLFQENLVPLQQVLQRQNVQVERIHLDLIQNHSGESTDLGHHGGNQHPHKRFNSGRSKPARTSEGASASFFNPKFRQELNILA